jgi:hypothetical protein
MLLNLIFLIVSLQLVRASNDDDSESIDVQTHELVLESVTKVTGLMQDLMEKSSQGDDTGIRRMCSGDDTMTQRVCHAIQADKMAEEIQVGRKFLIKDEPRRGWWQRFKSWITRPFRRQKPSRPRESS